MAAEAGSQLPGAKPAIAVTTDFGAELASEAGSGETPSDADGATVTAATDSANEVGADPVDAKPAIGVTTDFGVAFAEQTAAEIGRAHV